MEQPYSVWADWLSKFHTWPEAIQALWLVAVPVTVLGVTWIVMRGLRDMVAAWRGRGEGTLYGLPSEWHGPPLTYRNGRLRVAESEARALETRTTLIPPPPRHPRARPGDPRLKPHRRKTWMAATSAAMTVEGATKHSIMHPCIHASMQRGGWVYIMTNRRNGTLYIGVTSNLSRRVWEHREGLVDGFTRRYGLKRLVWYERHDDIRLAIQREKTMKHWPRAWKVRLIHGLNPEWDDLYETLHW